MSTYKDRNGNVKKYEYGIEEKIKSDLEILFDSMKPYEDEMDRKAFEKIELNTLRKLTDIKLI